MESSGSALQDPPVTPEEDEAFAELQARARRDKVKIGVVIPVGAGRDENLAALLTCLMAQTRAPEAIMVVEDGPGSLRSPLMIDSDYWGPRIVHVAVPKHQPGLEQPRNVGVRVLKGAFPHVTHVWFLDSDLIVDPDCLEELYRAHAEGPEDRILVAPYDWLGPGVRPEPGESVPLELHQMDNDPRWPSFHRYQPSDVLRGDLAAGLACFSGNLVWPIAEFVRVGGFWSEIHHGRCEDGELGLRAVAMGVGISFAEYARGWHQDHDVDIEAVCARNTRDVPMLNARHPWVEGGGVFVVDHDGKRFDVTCRRCGATVNTNEWWHHAEMCGDMAIPV